VGASLTRSAAARFALSHAGADDLGCKNSAGAELPELDMKQLPAPSVCLASRRHLPSSGFFLDEWIPMPTTTSIPTIDVPSIAPQDRHPLIFTTFRELQEGQAMALWVDHEPLPLLRQFEGMLAGQFSWDYLESGPLRWHVRITKVAQPQRQCCGACGGA
jgi:uncharacterized protein (DUF2249 family)